MGQKLSFVKSTCATGPAGDVFDKVEVDKPVEEDSKNCIGTMESLHNVSHEIFPQVFEGLKTVFNQGINSHFQLNHSWTFSESEKQSGYKFGATYVGHNKISEREVYPIMLGELHSNGNLTAQIMQMIRPNLTVKYACQMRLNKIDGQQFNMEYKHPKLNVGVGIVNPSIQNKEISLIFDLMRKMTDNISVGSMMVIQRSQCLQFNTFGIWGIGGEYKTDLWKGAVTVRPLQSSVHSTFHIKFPKWPELQLASELEINVPQSQCLATAGYQLELGAGNSSTGPHGSETTILKSQIDSNWRIATSYERKFVTPIPFSVTFTVNGDLWKSSYGLGIGFSIF